MISCTLGPLAKCSPLELVLVKADETTDWAIVGARAQGVFPLVFLTGEDAPFFINVLPDPGDFERYSVARYATNTNYRFIPDPTGPSQIGEGELFRTAGSLVLTEDGEWHLLASPKGQGNVRWFNLKTGQLMGERGLQMIAFADWSLCVKGQMQEPSETTLLRYAASTDVAEDDD